jgi:16S rRNA C967 or C1407 C5-methylase (RsmB/RsmF family)
MKKKKGLEAFDEYYGSLFGERWESLKSSLLEKKKHAAYINPFFEGEKSFLDDAQELGLPNSYIKDIWEKPTKGEYYLLDPASILAPLALEINEGDEVIDLCAAPGGKSLIMALQNPKRIVCNDLSHNRLQRIKRTFETYLPETIKEKVTFAKHDATRWCLYEKNAYDKILLDAPCSSEKHLLESGEEMKEWKEGRTKRLSKLQWNLLSSALEIAKPGGVIVYSTCSISNLENDKVIEKLLEKKEGQVEILQKEFPFGEATQYGWEILPDKHQFGPFYLAVIQKTH